MELQLLYIVVPRKVRVSVVKENNGSGQPDDLILIQPVYPDEKIADGVKDEYELVDMESLLKDQLEEFRSEGWLLSVPVYSISQDESMITCTVPLDDEMAQVIIVKLERIGVGIDVGCVAKVLMAGRSDIREMRRRKEKQQREERARSLSRLLHSHGEKRGIIKDAIRKTRQRWKLGSKTAALETPTAKGPQMTLANGATYKHSKFDEKFFAKASALRVEALSKQVADGMFFGFDFIIAIIVAAVVAGMGLIGNSSVNLIASMLISPLMGPILGFTFGANIRDWGFAAKGVRVEFISLLMCIAAGFLLMLMIMADNPDYVTDWVTTEMYNRGQRSNLAAGSAVAFVSGAAVSVSLLSENTASLVGVAISASLLPPAVNCGMLWAYWLLGKAILEGSESYKPHELHQDPHDAFRLGGISLALTLINILCIFVAGGFMFWVKRISPTILKRELPAWMSKNGNDIAASHHTLFDDENEDGSTLNNLFDLPQLQKLESIRMLTAAQTQQRIRVIGPEGITMERRLSLPLVRKNNGTFDDRHEKEAPPHGHQGFSSERSNHTHHDMAGAV